MEPIAKRENFWQRFCRHAAPVAIGLWVAGIGVRWCCQDQFDGVALLFYATPWPVMMVLPVGPALWWFRQRQSALAGTALLAAAVSAIAWWHHGWFAPSPTGPELPTLRVLFRNLGHPHDEAWRDDIATTAREDADLIGLVEAETDSPERQRQLHEAFPDHAVVCLPHGLVLAVRGEILASTFVELDERSRCHVARVRLLHRTLTVVLVDLESTPWRSRRESFARLDTLLGQHAGDSLIVMGDFNTPRDSVYFRPWRASRRQAFEAAGRGGAETWPWPVPVLCIDHVWSSVDMPAVACVRRWYAGHDHAGLLVGFR